MVSYYLCIEALYVDICVFTFLTIAMLSLLTCFSIKMLSDQFEIHHFNVRSHIFPLHCVITASDVAFKFFAFFV